MATTDSRATRIYRALLRLLPFDFRSDFGPEMETVFHEQHQEAGRRNEPRVFCVSGGKRLWEFSGRRRASTWRCSARMRDSRCG